MKKNCSFSLFFIILYCISACSSEKKESSVIPDTKGLLIRQIENLVHTNPDSALFLSNEYLYGKRTAVDSCTYYQIMNQYAVLKAGIGQLDSSLILFEQAERFWRDQQTEKANDHLIILYYNKAFAQNNFGYEEDALRNLRLSDSLAEGSSNYSARVFSNLVMATIHSQNDRYKDALECVEKSIAICEANKDSSLMISSLQAYADLFINCHFFDEASVLFEKLQGYSNHFNSNSLFMHYMGRGRMQYLKGDLEASKEEYLKAYQSIRSNDVFDTLVVSFNLAEVYLYLNQLDSASLFLDKLAFYSHYLEQLPLFKFNYKSLRGGYYVRTGALNKARESFLAADKVCETFEIDRVLLKLHLQRKSEFYQATGDFRSAFSSLQSYNKVHENIMENNNRLQVAGLQYKYERDTTIIGQKNLIALNQEKIKKYKLRNAVLYYSIGLMLLVGLFVWVVDRKNKKIEKERNLRKMNSLKMENVRGRISPHFTFNVLNNIWAIIDDREKAREKFDNLMSMIRNSLVNSEKIAIPLKDEIEFVKCFLDLQNLRSGEGINVVWQIDPGIDMFHPIPGMILQIPVENAIKHGLLPMNGERNLTIRIGLCDACICFEICDNGVGFRSGSAHGTGTGLKVLYTTMHLLNQANHDRMSFEVTDLNTRGGNGTQVFIKVPLNFKYHLAEPPTV